MDEETKRQPIPRLKRYKKDLAHSYTFGVFPTLELLAHRPQNALGVVAHPQGLENSGIIKMREICRRKRIPFEIREKTFPRLGARENDFAVGVFRKAETGLNASTDHVILVNPGGTGNLGTIIRTMLGFGFHDLAIIEPAADIFHPETIRASMGALFQLRFARFESFEAYLERFPRQFYLLMTDGATALPEARFHSPFGLVFGNESRGLGPQFRPLGTSVRIPQSTAIDSLNLAVSVGVTLYQASIQPG